MPGRMYGTLWTALGKSGDSTLPFSPILPVIDSLALLRIASVKVIYKNKQTNKQTHTQTKNTHHTGVIYCFSY